MEVNRAKPKQKRLDRMEPGVALGKEAMKEVVKTKCDQCGEFYDIGLQ